MLYLCGKLRKEIEHSHRGSSGERRDHHHDKDRSDRGDRRKSSADEMEIERALFLKRQRSTSVPKSATTHLIFEEKKLEQAQQQQSVFHRTASGRRPRGVSPPEDYYCNKSLPSGSPIRRPNDPKTAVVGGGSQVHPVLQRRRSSVKRRSSSHQLLKQTMTESSESEKASSENPNLSIPIGTHFSESSHDHLVSLANAAAAATAAAEPIRSRRNSKQLDGGSRTPSGQRNGLQGDIPL